MGAAIVKDDDEFMDDNVTKVDQNSMNPTFLSDIVHCIPHVDFRFENIENDYFDPRSRDYNKALFIIGMVPILIAVFMVLALFGFKRYRENFASIYDKHTECLCSLQKLYSGCALAVLIALICEVILHFNFFFRFRAVHIPEPRDFADFQTKIMEKIALLKLEPYKRFPTGNYMKLAHVEDLYEVYRVAMLKVIDAVIKVRSQQLEPREAHTPLKQYIVILEWIRFIIFIEVWAMAFAIIIWYRRRLILRIDTSMVWVKCSMCGIAFTAIMTMYLSVASVAVADFCQIPSETVTVIRPVELTRDPYLMKQCEHFCQSYRHALYMSTRNFLWYYRDAKRIVFRELVARGDIIDYVTNAKEVNREWPHTTTKYYYRRKYAEDIYKVFEEIDKLKVDDTKVDWHEQLECSKGINYDDQPEDARPLCRSNAVLFWLLVQMLMMILCNAMFIVIVVVIFSRVPRIRKLDHT